MLDLTTYKNKFLKENKLDTKTLKRAKAYRVQENKDICPYCKASNLTTDYERCETYCNECGLVTSASITYVGLRKVFYSHGRKI